jgi:hypothetical protein
MTDTANEYKKIGNFEKRVLKKPLEEINEHTHFNVTYEKIKKGRTIDSIQFHISKKAQPQELNGEYKEREQDPAYLQGKANKEVNQIGHNLRLKLNCYFIIIVRPFDIRNRDYPFKFSTFAIFLPDIKKGLFLHFFNSLFKTRMFIII